jgi:hypothetical protein
VSKENIPQTDSIEQLAEFWDTHDLTDFEDELEEAAQPAFERGMVVRLFLPKNEAEAVEKIAKSKGVGFAEIIHQWITERVQPQ